ncbi:hypothetical protein BBB57_01345 [Kosakonia sacchari]|uniref:acyltransferase family protein n=1 Tax=Kosakonia sacchari TaxID=1158459 RepID=UPI0008073423|nr:acyltransferase [Kosakonia sacchari]ANR77018.1 hypothetical protein BBB57_01345 [Kosakonia sacchari]
MFKNIQAMRAIAAVLVVLYHFAPHFSIAIDSSVPTFLFSKWAYFGVDIFFVISGFVITNSINNKGLTPGFVGNFLSLRLARIYSGYFPFMLSMLFVYYYTNPVYLSQISVFNSLLLTSINQQSLILPVSWSITFELFFYAVLIALFYLSNRRIVMCLVIITMSLVYNTFLFNRLNILTTPFICEFLYGVIIRLCLYRLINVRVKNILAVMPLAIFMMYYASKMGYGNGIGRVLTFGMAAAYFVSLAVFLEKKDFIFSNFIVKLGDSSYTIYLSHLIFISLFFSSGLRGWLYNYDLLLSLPSCVLFIFFIITFSHIYSRLIEIPVYKSLKRIILSKKEYSIGSSAVK